MSLTLHLDAVRVGLADEDPWHGIASYVTAAAAMQARDRGTADLVITEMPTAPEIEKLRSRAFDVLVQLSSADGGAPERPDEHGSSDQINTRLATI